MRNLLRIIRKKLVSGEDLVLVTVIAASGTTPRGAGARMLVGQAGPLWGTLGGGTLEHRSLELAHHVLTEKASLVRDFSPAETDTLSPGTGRGSSVFFHYLPAGDTHTVTLCDLAEEEFRCGNALWLLTDVGKWGKMGLYSRELGYWGIPTASRLPLSRQPKRTGDVFAEQINTAKELPA